MNHRRHTVRFAIAAVILGAALGRPAVGQTPAPAKPPVATGPIQYVGPDTYLLLDSAGRPQPVLGMSYEQFVAAWRKLHEGESPGTEPRFTIDQIEIRGEARDDHAELSVELTLQSRVAGPLKVPLGLSDAVLLAPPTLESQDQTKGESSERSFLEYQADSGGYVAWIEGAPGQRRVSFKLVRPLVRDGNETSLELNLPRAAVARLTLVVPTAIVDASTTGSGILSREATDTGGTRLNVAGPSGDFRLRWTTSLAPRPELATVLSSTGAIAVSIDGHSIRSDAHLSVRSYGGTFDRFRVRLPPGAQLVDDRPGKPGTAPEYHVIVDEPSSASKGQSQVVTVELAEKQLGPVEVELSTEQPLGLPQAERAMELAGFEVLGAVRQFGDVAVSVADDWQLRWENGPYVRQVERSELPDALRDAQPTVAFQYDRQPWSMRAQLVARPMVVYVTPDYALDVGPDEAVLHARLNYQIPGARAFEFHVQLSGWQLAPEPIESNGLVDRDRILVTREGVLVLPLGQASSRRAEVVLTLRRGLGRNEAAFSLPLPVPEADTVASAELAVSADPAIELLPDISASRGLLATPVTGESPLPASQNGRQSFHYRSYAPNAVFAAHRSVRPREVKADIETQLSVDRLQLRATQDLDYEVKYQPLGEIAVELPDGWSITGDRIQISPASGDTEPGGVAVNTEPATAARSSRVGRAALTQPRLGKFRAHVEYQLDPSAASLEMGTNLLALPQPVGVQIARQRASLTPVAGLNVAVDAAANSVWQPAGVSPDNSARSWTAAGPARDLPLNLEPVARAGPQFTDVDRIWLQSWQAGNAVQDRAVFRFHTTGREVAIELPPLIAPQDVEVLLDGNVAHAATPQPGRLLVDLPPVVVAGDAHPTSHTLELRYRRSAPAGLITRYKFTPPQLVGSCSLSDVYWQFVLPGDRHFVTVPDQLFPLDPRQWLEVFWGRPATKSQAELETWAGATHQLGPTRAQNAYLFSGLAPVASIECITAPRWLIVLASSAAVLSLVLVGIYVPVLRRGRIVLVLAAIVAGAATIFPDAALLVGQASVLGVVLAALAVGLRRWAAARLVPRQPTVGGSTNLRLRSSLRSDSHAAPALAHSSGGTPTPLFAEVPELDR